MLKRILTTVGSAMLIGSCAYAVTPKLAAGDCITPTNRSYSWYGVFARVEAVSRIEGYGSERRYILSFREFVSNSAILSSEIESNVKRVERTLCV
jgi:hypothetical protein